ncbi:hypothetical protein [Telluribacter sp. SYSU D00476]|uniref:hypothetical protein n=1 Tax=Telluribacter sp. SYSU D00476 TaxID=2811430 RepID=UPI001FF48E59|nr:hypothetical protein [Telluribacter sp. SYSU D00476]
MNHYSTNNKRFLVIVVHSSEIGLAYVQDGKISDTACFNYSQSLTGSAYSNPLITGVWPQVQAYFDKVDDVLAYNMVVHKTNLREMLTYHGLELPEKKYVCVYYWARAVLGITSLRSLYELIDVPGVPTSPDAPLYQTDTVQRAEFIARIAIYLQNMETFTAPLPEGGESTTVLPKPSLTKQEVF